MKTSYYSKYRAGAGAVCISTYPPKWIKEKIPEYLKLAPQFNFRIGYDEYLVKYSAQLAKLNPHQVWEELHQLTKGVEPVLLCYEAPPFNRHNFCHRHMVAEWFENHLGIIVPEWEKPETDSLF